MQFILPDGRFKNPTDVTRLSSESQEKGKACTWEKSLRAPSRKSGSKKWNCEEHNPRFPHPLTHSYFCYAIQVNQKQYFHRRLIIVATCSHGLAWLCVIWDHQGYVLSHFQKICRKSDLTEWKRLNPSVRPTRLKSCNNEIVEIRIKRTIF